MIAPSKNRVTLKFGATSSPYSASSPHKGTDFAYLPDPIAYAVEDGDVQLVPWDGKTREGNMIILTNGNRRWAYCHLAGFIVGAGKVKKGQKLGVIGATGFAFGKHLHITMRISGNLVNIEDYIDEPSEGDIIVGKVTIIGTPTSISWDKNRIDIFVCGSDNKLWHKWYDGKWNAWENVTDKYLVGLVTPSLSVASWEPGRLDIQFRGGDGDLVHIWYSGGKFQGPEALGFPKE